MSLSFELPKQTKVTSHFFFFKEKAHKCKQNFTGFSGPSADLMNVLQGFCSRPYGKVVRNSRNIYVHDP